MKNKYGDKIKVVKGFDIGRTGKNIGNRKYCYECSLRPKR